VDHGINASQQVETPTGVRTLFNPDEPEPVADAPQIDTSRRPEPRPFQFSVTNLLVVMLFLSMTLGTLSVVLDFLSWKSLLLCLLVLAAAVVILLGWFYPTVIFSLRYLVPLRHVNKWRNVVRVVVLAWLLFLISFDWIAGLPASGLASAMVVVVFWLIQGALLAGAIRVFNFAARRWQVRTEAASGMFAGGEIPDEATAPAPTARELIDRVYGKSAPTARSVGDAFF